MENRIGFNTVCTLCYKRISPLECYLKDISLGWVHEKCLATKCPACDGTAVDMNDDECPVCHGSGKENA
jgi:DnaJ-class molecular chaperone